MALVTNKNPTELELVSDNNQIITHYRECITLNRVWPFISRDKTFLRWPPYNSYYIYSFNITNKIILLS